MLCLAGILLLAARSCLSQSRAYLPVNGAANECYVFGDKCGCDATFTCWTNLGDPEYDGSGGRLWNQPCKSSITTQLSGVYTGAQGISRTYHTPENSLYDNSEGTRQNLQGLAELYLGYHLQRDRRIVGAIVKGTDSNPAVTKRFDVGAIRDGRQISGVNVFDQSKYDINPFNPAPTAARAKREFSNPVGVGYSDKVAVVHTDLNGSYAYLYKPFFENMVISEFRVYEYAATSRCASTVALNETKPASRTSYNCFRVQLPNQPLVNGRCGKCFYFNRRCGCDATFTCGASRNELCAMPTVHGRLTDDLALVDDDESTYFEAVYDTQVSNLADYGTALSIDMERPRKIVSVLVKGFDQNGEWAMHSMKWTNDSNAFGLTSSTSASDNILYTSQNRVQSLAASASTVRSFRYVHMIEVVKQDEPFKVSEFRVFEEFDKSFCSYLDPPQVSVGCSSLALLDHQTSTTSNTVPLASIAGNATSNSTCLLQKFTASDRLLFYKLNVEAQNSEAINLANYVKVTALALGVSEDKVKIVVSQPAAVPGARRLLQAGGLILLITVVAESPTQATALANEVYTSGFQSRLQVSAAQNSVPVPIVLNSPIVVYDSVAGLLSTLNLTMDRPVGIVVILQPVQAPPPSDPRFSRAPRAHGAGTCPLVTALVLVLFLQAFLWVHGQSLFSLA